MSKPTKQYAAFPKEKDIRNAIVKYLNEEHAAQSVKKKTKITDQQLSTFLNNKAGMQFDNFTRILISCGFKLYNNKGELIFGNPEEMETELSDNNHSFVEINSL